VKSTSTRTNYSLLDIALTCGFADQSHLNRVFKKHAGVPPGQYRRHH
jgi:AraC-like DNA-binding protein